MGQGHLGAGSPEAASGDVKLTYLAGTQTLLEQLEQLTQAKVK